MTDESLLHRQVNPSWVQAGRITSQVFRPTPKDERLLSVCDGDLMTAEGAWQHFVNELKFPSAGVVSVAVGECRAQSLAVRSDPTPFPEHAVIDYSAFAKGDIERKAKALRAAAEARGWLYRAMVMA